MALVIDEKNVYGVKQPAAALNVTYSPGNIVPDSGIYRCAKCGKEIAANQGTPFPPQNHHQHTISEGNIEWRVVVLAQ